MFVSAQVTGSEDGKWLIATSAVCAGAGPGIFALVESGAPGLET